MRTKDEIVEFLLGQAMTYRSHKYPKEIRRSEIELIADDLLQKYVLGEELTWHQRSALGLERWEEIKELDVKGWFRAD